MNLTPTRTGPSVLPPLDALILRAVDLPGFSCLFEGAQDDTNEAVAARAANPDGLLRRLTTWGRVDGYAARFVPASLSGTSTTPIVVDSSAARFSRGAGALLALTDESSLLGAPGVARLFPRNIADNTECISEVFEEDGVQFTLFRADFRVNNILGSVGAVWRRPYGSPLDVLRLGERQAVRIRAALASGNEASAQASMLGHAARSSGERAAIALAGR